MGTRSRTTCARHVEQRATWPVRAQGLVRILAMTVVIFTSVVILGWAFDVETIIELGVGPVTMHPLTALSLGAVAVGLLGERGGRLRTLFYGGALLLGALIDLYLVAFNPWGVIPSPSTAVSLLALPSAGLVADRGKRVTAQCLAGMPLLIGFTTTYAYLLGLDHLYRFGGYTSLAQPTSLTIVAVGLAIMLTVPHGTLQWIIFGQDSGARTQRALVPIATLLMPAVSLIYVRGLHTDFYSLAFGTAAMTSFVGLLILVVGYRAGRAAHKRDKERDLLLEELHRVNSQLEDRVRQKVVEVNRQRTRLALFEERDRIARDLHDRVIQRIFASGLQVASLGRTVRKQSRAQGLEWTVAEDLDVIAVELDLAIRELRNSIFELTSIGDVDNVDQVVRDIAARAARILGFSPKIDVSGQVAGLSAELVAHLASVVQEALSNVARHARASWAEVRVVGDDTHLEVRVTDDGVGLPDPLPRSSGITNLTNRARQLGGTATWSNRAPHGTVLVWQVPRPGQQAEDPHAESRLLHA